MESGHEVGRFLEQKRLAVVGASASGAGFGAAAYKTLKDQGWDVVPIHPSAESIAGDHAYRSFSDLPEPVTAALFVVPPSETEKLISEAADAGVEHVWLQQGAASPRAVELCAEKGLNAIADECILMYAAGGAFPHNLHRWVWRLVGKLRD